MAEDAVHVSEESLGQATPMSRAIPLTMILAAGLCAAITSGCNRPTAAEAPAASATAPAAAQSEPMQQIEETALKGATPAANPTSLVVTVNGRSLTRADADRRMRLMVMSQGMPESSAAGAIASLRPQLEPQVISQFVDTVLLSQEAEKRGMAVTTQEVDTVVSNLSTRLPEGTTLEAFAATRGMTVAEIRSEIGTGERIRKLYEAETATVPAASDEDIHAFYTNNLDKFETPEQVSASHILIKCDEKADADAQKAASEKAEALRAQLIAGTNFAALAKAESACPSAAKGGDLGTFGRGQMVPAFEEAAFSQEIGAIGPVVRTPFGFHIIQVTSRDKAGKMPQEEASSKIREYLDGKKKNEKFGGLVDTLRATAEISPTNAVSAAR